MTGCNGPSKNHRVVAGLDEHDGVSFAITSSFRSSNDRRLGAAESAEAGNTAWISAGHSATVAGYTIRDGMIYVGRNLEPVYGCEDVEPALIDPSLAVDPGAPDRAGDSMGYWPSYSEIEPASRAAYLEWLSDGRRTPTIGTGYVFLFFYGLERRLLCDLPHLPDYCAEAGLLMREIERLLSIYGGNRSFKKYATALLHTADVLWGSQRMYETAPTFGAGLTTGHLNVRLALAQLVDDGRPIPADWALAWLLSDPATKLRAPAQHCPAEFQRLFAVRYGERFGDGIQLERTRTTFEVSYGPASRSLSDEMSFPARDLPDVMTLAHPRSQLREIADGIMNELDPYSRFIGRNPDEAESLKALALLPAVLVDDKTPSAVEDLRTWLDFTLGLDTFALVSARELIGQWQCARDDRMSKAELEEVASALESVGFGVEPDPRFGGRGIACEQRVVIFELAGEPLTSATPAYQVATLLLHLTTLVATSDGEVDQEEERRLEEHLERFIYFSAADRQRLRVHVRWLLAERPGLTGTKQRLEKLDAEQRQVLAEYAIAMAAADGVIESSEVQAVTYIYELLGFEPERAHEALQAFGAPQTSSTTVVEPDIAPAATELGGRVALSENSPAAKSSDSYPASSGTLSRDSESALQLDLNRVQQTLADTDAVASVLSKIFCEHDDDSTPPMTTPVASREPFTLGLDAAHAQLLGELNGRTELSRAEFESLATAAGLLPDGAYEILNEAAFDRVDAPLLQNDDPIEIDLAVLAEIQE